MVRIIKAQEEYWKEFFEAEDRGDMSHSREMKRLSRAELLDIIYEMKKNEVSLRERLDAAEAELNKKEILMNNAGSIAEASLALSNIFEAAQQAADTYVRSVKAGLPDQSALMEQTEQERNSILQSANQEAERLLKDTKLKCVQMMDDAKVQMKEREEKFRNTLSKLINENPELRTAFMNRNR